MNQVSFSGAGTSLCDHVIRGLELALSFIPMPSDNGFALCLFPHHQHWSPSLFHTSFHLFYTGPHLSLSLNLYQPCPHPQPVPCLRMQQPKDLRTSLILNRLKYWSNKLLRCTTMSRPSLLVLIKAYIKSVRRSVISTLLPHYNM